MSSGDVPRKNAYTGQTDARRKANAKYLKETVEDIRIRVPKGRKAELQAAAAVRGESLNGFVTTAIDERLTRLQASAGGVQGNAKDDIMEAAK